MDGAERLVEIRVEPGIDRISAADWDACAAPEAADGGRARAPFVSHRFLRALEASGSAVPAQGWAPHHLVASSEGRVVGVLPLYLKGHSQGEYIFDHAWAHAWERAGGQYYPKLQSAVPFTPVPGPRLMARPDAPLEADTIRTALIEGAVELAGRNGLSSLHITFCDTAEWELGRRLGLLQRTDQQFHWRNRGYADFDAFLADLFSRKRKQIRKERARALSGGVEVHWLTGDALRPGHWDAFWAFYQDTGARKWGQPYLTRAFFELAHETMRDEILLVLCRRAGRWIAGALNFIGRDALFGRYWGCVEDHPFLHFEACYYQAMDFAIAHGLARVEAGAQGPHKIARGYEPVTTRSLHWIADPGFRRAVADYLRRERAAVDQEQALLAAMTPFRREG
ncbi:MAG TPA: GNAT family N-acetyltransferase [Thermohalobaculum sp.]|nr:GNAT family N-acetyltransferase [Thermohalobaculum sp.]